jgi:hypothetical protein
MLQAVEESKSIDRIKTNYIQDAIGNDDIIALWREMEKQKEENLAKMQGLIKKYNA